MHVKQTDGITFHFRSQLSLQFLFSIVKKFGEAYVKLRVQLATVATALTKLSYLFVI